VGQSVRKETSSSIHRPCSPTAQPTNRRSTEILGIPPDETLGREARRLAGRWNRRADDGDVELSLRLVCVNNEASALEVCKGYRNDRLGTAVHEALEGCDRVVKIPASAGVNVRRLGQVGRMIDLHDDSRPLAVYRRDEGRTGLPGFVFLYQLESHSPSGPLVAVRPAAGAGGDGERKEHNW